MSREGLIEHMIYHHRLFNAAEESIATWLKNEERVKDQPNAHLHLIKFHEGDHGANGVTIVNQDHTHGKR